MQILSFILRVIRNNPLKLIFGSMVIALIFAAGVPGLNLATGNETLIEEETMAYQNNQTLENEFGGESIIVLYEAADPKDLLTIETIAHMEGLEKQLGSYQEIYAVISPNTIIRQMSAKQSEKLVQGLGDVSSGLEKMGSGLNSISGKLGQNLTGQPPGGMDLAQKFAGLNDGIGQMINGQQKLAAGTAQLASGYAEFGSQLHQAAVKLQNVSGQLGKSVGTNTEAQQQVQQLAQLGSQFSELSKKMSEVSAQGSKLTAIPENTITGLNNMRQGLNDQISAFSELNAKQSGQLQDLGTLRGGLSDMGGSLNTISENLGTMVSFADNIYPGLPQRQETLNKMFYEDNGQIRDVFSEVVFDGKYMIFMVKFAGNVDDTVKSNVTGTIKKYLDDNRMADVQILVSGKPVLDGAIRSSMKASMQKMMGMSIVFMVLVLTVVFRVKWRLLPLMVIMLAVIATVGLMGWLSIPMTMVSMAVLPILIGLGIDYAIQFQSRYSEEIDGRNEA